MATLRRQIREAFKARIVAAATAAGVRVFENRTRTFEESEMPAINIFTGMEDATIFSAAPKIYRRELEVFVEIYAMAKSDVEDGLDDLTAAVEAIFEGEDRFAIQDVTDDIVFGGSIASNEPGKATRQAASMQLKYLVTYNTRAGVNASAFDDLAKITAEWNALPVVADTEHPVDEIDLPLI